MARSRIAGAVLSLTVCGTLAGPLPAQGATAYLDAAAWLNAAANLGPVMLVPLTLHSPVFSDAWGTFTDVNETVHVPEGPPPGGGVGWNEGGERPRSVYLSVHVYRSLPGSGFLALGPDDILVNFGCFTAVYPCLGVQTFEAAFNQPVLGFGGLFEWYSGYREYPPIPLVVNGFELNATTPVEGSHTPVEGSHPWVSGFLGFIGPMDTLSMEWLGGNADNSSWIHWSAPFAIVAMAVPEPHAVALFAGALLALVAASAVRARPTPVGH
jgi:hypothetical protein